MLIKDLEAILIDHVYVVGLRMSWTRNLSCVLATTSVFCRCCVGSLGWLRWLLVLLMPSLRRYTEC